ncbi:toll/interleukin-1 receptor domain-containing protein [Roseivivax isoporae]|uniref:TIR domain-containing protein n=1 Tax=Roseivivax isoporae LMG 25204 TaxID=1449351 RepID=X7F7Y2_9RHOB|nr:toll/interleukin-1 receptor domain-containing protein [Roseivivax isoporae]ETX28843.1 hypothetical protein RISW2_04680 [Roseivivax isoporae LMG 25204]
MTAGAARRLSLFVSYSHRDTAPIRALDTSRLAELMEKLAYKLGADNDYGRFRFLLDKQGMLRVGDVIDDRIGEHLREADIGLIFLSRAYCESESCEKELRELLALGKRLCIVELDPFWDREKTSRFEDLRERVKKILTCRFWAEDSGTVRLFGTPVPSAAKGDSKADFTDALERLAAQIIDAADELPAPEAAAPPVVAGERAPETEVDVILAAPTRDAVLRTDRLENGYVAHGFVVRRLDRLPGEMTPGTLDAALTRGAVFVQVLGTVAGKRLPAFGDRPSAIAQHDAAVAAGLDTLVWTPLELDPEEVDADYAAFLSGIAAQSASAEDFEQYSIPMIETRRAPPPLASVDADTGYFAPVVSIDADPGDAVLRDRIVTALAEHVNVTCIDDDVDHAMLTDTMRNKNAIVLVYGDKPAGQKRAKAHFEIFQQSRAAIWNSARQRFEIAVGDASPVTAQPCPKGPNVHIIRIGDDIDRASMEAFLAKLRGEAARVA